MIRYDTSCNVCGAAEFRPFAKRTNGVEVLVLPCAATALLNNLGRVLRKNRQVQYRIRGLCVHGRSGGGLGGVPGFLTSEIGRVLDIGDANGRLLELLGDGYERFGIEPNPGMARPNFRMQPTESSLEYLFRGVSVYPLPVR
jgi:hypothetical protein